MLNEHRSGRLVAWGNAWIGGHTSLDTAAERIQEDGDEPHRASGVPGEDGQIGLTVALGRLRQAGAVGFRLALPRTGDPLGLCGPVEFNQAAMAAGEAVLVAGAPFGLIPSITPYGPESDRGHMVLWQVFAVDPTTVPDVPTLSEAERELASAMREATEELVRLDVARWRPEVAETLEAIRGHGRTPEAVLAPGYPPRAIKVLTQAQRLAAIADLASADDGAAVSATQSRIRTSLLSGLERTTRRAQLAAYHAILEPGRDG
jgi:hypothetical protein